MENAQVVLAPDTLVGTTVAHLIDGAAGAGSEDSLIQAMRVNRFDHGLRRFRGTGEGQDFCMYHIRPRRCPVTHGLGVHCVGDPTSALADKHANAGRASTACLGSDRRPGIRHRFAAQIEHRPGCGRRPDQRIAWGHGIDPLAFGQPQAVEMGWVAGIDDRSDLQLGELLMLLVNHRPRLAGSHAGLAFTARATCQAALCLFHRLLGGVAQLHFGVPLHAFRHRYFGHGHARLENHFGLGHGAARDRHLARVDHHFVGRHTSQIGVDGCGSLFTHADGFDHGHLVGGDGITCSKDAGTAGHKAGAVDIDPLVAGDGDAMLLAQEIQLGGLADGEGHQIHLDHELAVGDGHRPAPAAGVRLAQLHADTFQAGHACRCIAQDAHRGHQIFDGHTLLLSALYLFRQRRHFGPGAPVIDTHIFEPQPPQRAGHVHRGIAAAKHDGLGLGPLAQEAL